MSTNAPSSIADKVFFGHEHHVRDFTRLVHEGLLGHAYCFFGDEGVGKFRFAHAFANFLERGEWHTNETRPLTDTLVVACAGEKDVADDESTGRTSVGIDAVREVRKFLAATPFHSSHRTVIIRDAERLTWEAESALLKIMEEPPAHALILVVARSPEALFPPLVSRMSKIHFARLSGEKLKEILVNEYKVAPSEARLLAEHSFGRLGYALHRIEDGKRKKRSVKSNETLVGKLESLILLHWQRGAKKEAHTLSFLLSRFEAASRFNLNPRLQEKAISYMISK